MYQYRPLSFRDFFLLVQAEIKDRSVLVYIADALSFVAHTTSYSELLKRSGYSKHSTKTEAKQAVSAAVQMFASFGLGEEALETLRNLHGKEMCDEAI